ncbi:MAG: TonB-dependent receptor, partial [Acidobacteria bacterium]|nr:TonB-dependent receptor [Acidobacteriota bacterium]
MIGIRCRSEVQTILLVALFVLSASTNAHAQAVSARLEGRVMDPSQAIIPGVVVVATNENTNISTETITNDSGRFVFPNLTPGPYTLTAELPGFKKSVATGILLQIGDAKAQNLVLQVGDLSETVTVTGLGSAVDVTSTKVGAVVHDRQALDLPLQGRNAMMLIYLQAGTNPLDRLGGQQQVGVVDGLAPHTSSIKVEGILSSNPGYDYSPAHPNTPVPQEAVGEYRVSTSGEASDAGKGSGAQVKVLVKSGTNEFHGSVFEFNRNTVYNANNFFSNRAGEPRPVLRRNQFGFALGGPVIKDRTFFFVTAEWQRQNEDVIQNRLVYTSRLREGIFRFWKKGNNSGSLVDSNGNLLVPAEDIGSINLLTVDPTRQGLDTVFVQSKLFPQLPLPNNYDVGDGLNTAGYRYTSARPHDYHTWLFKIDHQLARSHQAAFSYSRGRERQPQPALVNKKSAEDYEELRDGASLRVVSTLSPKLTNEISLGANLRTALRPITNPDQETPKGNIYLTGLDSGNINIIRSYQSNPAVNMGFQDNMTWVKGNHTVSFGGEFWKQTLNRKVGTQEWPVIRTVNSSNPATVPSQPGLSSTDRGRAQQLTNDLTGAIGTITQSFYLNDPKGYRPYVNNYQQLRKVEWSLFIQDIWKMRPNFTLNFGLRYEAMPAVWI